MSFPGLAAGPDEGAVPFIPAQCVEKAYKTVCGPTGLYIFEPDKGRLDIFIFHDLNGVPVVQAGISRELRRVAVQAGIPEMQPDAGVDMEGEIEYRGALVDHHGSPVLTEDLDFGLIGIAGLDLVDSPLEERFFTDRASLPVAVIFVFCPDEKTVEIVPLICQKEIC